jgi:hypothetical protein
MLFWTTSTFFDDESQDPLFLSFSQQARMRAFLNARHLMVASSPRRAGCELAI